MSVLTSLVCFEIVIWACFKSWTEMISKKTLGILSKWRSTNYWSPFSYESLSTLYVILHFRNPAPSAFYTFGNVKGRDYSRTIGGVDETDNSMIFCIARIRKITIYYLYTNIYLAKWCTWLHEILYVRYISLMLNSFRSTVNYKKFWILQY